MSTVEDSPWERLGPLLPTGDQLRARTYDIARTERLFIGLDSAGRRHLLVELDRNEAEYIDSKSRGLLVRTNELVIGGGDSKRFIDIACIDRSGHPALDLVAKELGVGLATKGARAADIVSRVLNRWREFWGLVGRHALSREEQAGLVGELHFLQEWLLPRLPAIEAIRRWVGPSGAVHDFAWAGRRVEVKCTASTVGRVHRISSLEQLASVSGVSLFLFSVRTREVDGAVFSLAQLVERCRAQIGQDEAARATFDSALAAVGFNPAHADDYLRYEVVDTYMYAVTGNFPRVTASILGAAASGVVHLEYDVDLSAFNELRVAASPSEFPVD